jgi:hypothetical protein
VKVSSKIDPPARFMGAAWPGCWRATSSTTPARQESAQDGLTCPGLPLPCCNSPRPPCPSTTLPRPRSAILGPPGYRRACGMANGSLTRRLGQHPPCRVQADAALYPLCYELNLLARSVASKRSLPTRQITERRAELVPISRPRPLRSSVSTVGMRSGG